MGLAGLVSVIAFVALAGASGGHSPASNRAAARAQAALLLRMLRLPPGAAQSTGDPVGARLAQPGYDEATPNLVDAHRWWTFSGSAADVLAYVIAHLPADAKTYAGSVGSGALVSDSFSLPAIPGVLGERVLAVTTVQLSTATIAVRTDGEAVWVVPRPSWEQIPPTASSVSFTASGPTASGREVATSVPRTFGGARARALIRFINHLGVVQPGVRACPAAFATSVDLQFTDPAGETVAQAVEMPSGCAFVSLEIGTRLGPNLDDSPGVTTELERLNVIPTCRSAQLYPHASAPLSSSGEESITFGFINQSDAVCRLSGFARVVLLDATGHRLPVTAHDQGAALVRKLGWSAAMPLDPGQAASFVASWTRCGSARASQAQITLPGVAGPFSLITGSASRPFNPCRGRLALGGLSSLP